MKNAKWMLFVSMIVLSGMAVAQSISNSRIVAQVPFEFMAANKIIPAGECVVKSDSQDGTVLLIRNSDANTSLMSLSSHTEETKRSADTVLIFNRYGDHYFLSGMRLEGSNWTYYLPESKAEAELRAQNVSATEKTLLAAVK
jgi:hypothetical protein